MFDNLLDEFRDVVRSRKELLWLRLSVSTYSSSSSDASKFPPVFSSQKRTKKGPKMSILVWAQPKSADRYNEPEEAKRKAMSQKPPAVSPAKRWTVPLRVREALSMKRPAQAQKGRAVKRQQTEFEMDAELKKGYKWIKQLGLGGEGVSDLVRGPDDKLMVQKTLNKKPKLLNGKPAEARVLSEILGKHPRIIDMMAWYPTGVSTVYHLEYCSLGDLHDVCDNYHSRQTRIPEGFIWHCLLQLAQALAYIHFGLDYRLSDKGQAERAQERPIHVIHRDIKPENVFLKPSSTGMYPDVVLADFGLATDRLRTQDWVGTPLYQGPELPIQTPSSDVWALGATVHTVATGQSTISRTPRGWKTEEWELAPEARKVWPVTKFGYSEHLEECLGEILQMDYWRRPPSWRLPGIIERKRTEWSGEEKPLNEVWGTGKNEYFPNTDMEMEERGK